MKYKIFTLIVLTFIVKWVAVETHLTACPQPAPYTDEYGITHYPMNQNSLACYVDRKKPMEKRFETEEEADKFIKGMPINETYFGAGYVEHVEKFKQGE